MGKQRKSRRLVSIIIVNWNGGEIFENCLKSLAKITYPKWELVVVDNGSTDDSIEKIKNLKLKSINYSSKLKIIKNAKNLGFARANNQGFKKTKGEYVLLLNNDTEVKPDFLTKLVERIEKDPQIGVIQPKIKLLYKPTHLDSIGSFLTRTGFLQHLGYLEKDSEKFDREMFIFSAKGACMLIRKSVIDTVGLFDNDFGSYFEETDFCWRVWLAGFKILYYPQAQILHRVGFSSKRQDQAFVNYHAFKNRLATLIKNLDAKNFFIIGGIHFGLLLLLKFYYILRLRRKDSAAVGKAIFWNMFHIVSTLKKRRLVQKKIRTKSDPEIFEAILKPLDWRNMFVHFIRSERMLKGIHPV